MIRAQMEDLIRSSLISLGGVELERADGVTRYALVDGLVERLGRQELLVTFSSAVAAHRPDVELISAGSFLYDLILRLVRERGRAAGGWLPPVADLDAPALISRSAARLRERQFTRVKRVWGTSYLFSFRLGFYFDTPHEKLYTVRVDLERNRVRHEIHPGKVIEGALSANPSPENELLKADPERAFRLAWGKVEEEVARLTEKYRQDGEAHLLEETRTIEQYYRQLIEEEKRSREQKNTRRGRDESDQRIELLKLEWDRRIAEEKARLSPEVSVSLSCASRLRVPLEKWRLRPEAVKRIRGEKRGGGVSDFWVDGRTGEVWAARILRRKRAGKSPAAADDPPVPGETSPSPEEGPEAEENSRARPHLTLVEPLPDSEDPDHER